MLQNRYILLEPPPREQIKKGARYRRLPSGIYKRSRSFLAVERYGRMLRALRYEVGRNGRSFHGEWVVLSSEIGHSCSKQWAMRPYRGMVSTAIRVADAVECCAPGRGHVCVSAVPVRCAIWCFSLRVTFRVSCLRGKLCQ
ncbi:hypothetical protein KM043_009587 [Ampulex compressa]|nr:hypothetical protein KM043_009587 [Ampulex compressa]